MPLFWFCISAIYFQILFSVFKNLTDNVLRYAYVQSMMYSFYLLANDDSNSNDCFNFVAALRIPLVIGWIFFIVLPYYSMKAFPATTIPASWIHPTTELDMCSRLENDAALLRSGACIVIRKVCVFYQIIFHADDLLSALSNLPY